MRFLINFFCILMQLFCSVRWQIFGFFFSNFSQFDLDPKTLKGCIEVVPRFFREFFKRFFREFLNVFFGNFESFFSGIGNRFFRDFKNKKVFSGVFNLFFKGVCNVFQGISLKFCFSSQFEFLSKKCNDCKFAKF